MLIQWCDVSMVCEHGWEKTSCSSLTADDDVYIWLWLWCMMMMRCDESMIIYACSDDDECKQIKWCQNDR